MLFSLFVADRIYLFAQNGLSADWQTGHLSETVVKVWPEAEAASVPFRSAGAGCRSWPDGKRRRR